MVAACGGNDSKDTQNSLNDSIRSSRGPDPIVIRIPREGGSARAYLYPKLDSQIWYGTGTSVTDVMSFDPEGGTLALIDNKGFPSRIDLRFGVAARAATAKMASTSSIDGSTIYGIDDKGAVVRLTRTADWKFEAPSPVTSIFPQTDGSLVIMSRKGEQSTLWKMRPPETKLLDTVVISTPSDAISAQVGDRIYFATDSGIVGIRTRDMTVVTPINLRHRAKVLSPTPSGDRIYAALEGQKGLQIIDRYTDQATDRIDLPGQVSQIRMDPLGRYVIARPLQGDSAWVVAVSTNRVVGTISTKWTHDLPACAQDGAIAVSQGNNVVFLDGETLQAVRTITGGNQDYWYFTYWNGFRPSGGRLADMPVASADPRDANRDEEDDSYPEGYTDRGYTSDYNTGQDSQREESPYSSPGSQADAPTSTPARLPSQSQSSQASQAPSSPASPSSPAPSSTTPSSPGTSPTPAPNPVVASQLYTVSFATMLSAEKARDLANSIVVNGIKARVVESVQAGTPIFRVILGPYTNRETAERIGRESGRQHWVFGGEP